MKTYVKTTARNFKLQDTLKAIDFSFFKILSIVDRVGLLLSTFLLLCEETIMTSHYGVN